uniref:ornithine decarboxylase n=1 Tax=Heterorhabditis bacteriophora TaxID=37862 RepID=A0A1I7XL36_HETBA
MFAPAHPLLQVFCQLAGAFSTQWTGLFCQKIKPIARDTRIAASATIQVGILDYKPDPIVLARQITQTKDVQESDDAFMLINLDMVMDRFRLWKRELPMIEPFYAVKCNTDAVLVRTLASLGVGFDCASKEEIDIVMEMGVCADRIIYANPCKTRSFIAHAREREVRMMTFDNVEELEKINRIHSNAELVPLSFNFHNLLIPISPLFRCIIRMILRIAVSDPTATCPLNLKFGADPVLIAPQLLIKAKELGVNVIGISFHVGSGCNDPATYRTAISHAQNLFEIGIGLGLDMKVLDMGGGFPGAEHHTSFEEVAERDIASVIRSAINDFFPTEKPIRLIAEPGRFFAAAPFTLVCNVIHATEVTADKISKDFSDADRPGFMYYLNDGVYGSFNCILFDHVQPVGRPLFDEIEEEYLTTVWGPTCDSLDKIEDQKWMRRLSVGDWVVYSNMGAYTSAASTTFNGFQRPTPIYVINRDNWLAGLICFLYIVFIFTLLVIQ